MNYYENPGKPLSTSIWNGIKNSFCHGSSLIRLIYINIGLFLSMKIINVIFILTGFGDANDIFLDNLGLPAYWHFVLYRPWTIITYMFTQFGFFHLLFNMLWLYWFGNIFLNHFSQKELTGVYLLGGFAGALLYLLSYNTLPFFERSLYYSVAIGASASVMAIVFAVCTYLPQYRIYIFLIGPVKLIHLAVFTAIIDILSIPSSNAGGHIAHLGGALFGYLFVVSTRRQLHFTRFFVSQLQKIGYLWPGRKKMRVKYKKSFSSMNDREYNEYKKRREDMINNILDKISRSGYESLSREEKEILFKSDKR